MKKIVTIILTFMLITNISMAFAADYSSMTDEQLKEAYSVIRNELLVRGFKAENKKVIVDQNGIQIYINGDIKLEKKYSWDTTFSLYIPIVFINNSSVVTNMIVKYASVNGWKTDSSDDIGSVPAGKKAKGNLIFELTDTDVEKLSDFADVEFSVNVYNDNTWKDLFTTEPITIYAAE